jgi:hypothetical protein
MKTYFLALNNTDFTKSGNTWTSSSFDLYSNRFYTNYSTYRSQYGNNGIGDYVFTGTKVLDSATPTTALDPNAIVTDYGEIVQDLNYGEYHIFNYDEESSSFFLFNGETSSTPFQLLTADTVDNYFRFIDTSSSIDLVRI